MFLSAMKLRFVAFTHLLCCFTVFSSAFAQSTSYKYDELGRLTRMDNPGQAVVTYAYDAAGNRVQITSVPPNCTNPDAYYYYNNPDVQAAGVHARTHWDTYGWREGRLSCWPNP